jgi:hypothetical protein
MAKKTPTKGRAGGGKGRTGSKAERASARERIAAARAAERRRERRRWMIMWVVTGVMVAVLAGMAFWAISAKNASDRKADRAAAIPGTGLPPWARPADTAKRAKAVGLSVSAMEGSVTHFHAHLDVLVNGQKIPLPADLGIDPSGTAMAEMHTHDATGVVHIEAPSANKRYTLRQLFDEWNVKLDATALGGLKADSAHPLTVYINGQKQTGDPGAIKLAAHQEIALVYGPTAGVQVPSTYAFAQGE